MLVIGRQDLSCPGLYTEHIMKSYLGWPNVRWYYTEKLGKPPKDWRPPSSLDRASPAYIEVSIRRDVGISRDQGVTTVPSCIQGLKISVIILSILNAFTVLTF